METISPDRGTGNGRIAEQIKAGVIGPLREVHNWTNRPVWPQYTEISKDRPPVPKGFDWDLWLGPTLDRPYHPNYTHTVFRGWYDFGGGSMADMGIYSLWPVFTALDLDAPASARPEDVARLDATPGKSVTLDVRWRILAAPDKPLRIGRSNVTEPVKVAGFDAVVAAANRAVGAVSREIAEAVKNARPR